MSDDDLIRRGDVRKALEPFDAVRTHSNDCHMRHVECAVLKVLEHATVPDCPGCARLTAEVERLDRLNSENARLACASVCCDVATEKSEYGLHALTAAADDCNLCACARGDTSDAEVERLTEAVEEKEAQMHARIRAGYDRTVADSWRAEVARIKARVAELEAALERTQMVLKALHAGLSSHPNSAHSVLCGAANSRPCAVIDQMADNYAALAPKEPE